MRNAAALLLLPGIVLAAPADPAERKLKVEFDDLAGRATADIDAVNAMEDRAKQHNQALDPLILTQRDLVAASMNEADDSLRAKDFDKLRKRLERARALIEKLDKMI